MNKTNEQILHNLFEQKLKEMFQKGLLQGSKAVCKVIYDKANDNKNNANEKIDEIKRFCEVSLNNKK